jgi:hypothetical protein
MTTVSVATDKTAGFSSRYDHFSKKFLTPHLRTVADQGGRHAGRDAALDQRS